MKREADVIDVDSAAWLVRYRSDARLYAWGFFVLISAVIAVVIRLSLDDWGTDWLYSTIFAVMVTAALALHSRRSAESAWVGAVESKNFTERRRDEADSGMREASYRVVFRTQGGKTRTLRVSSELFGRYREGEAYRKVAGLHYPLPISPDTDLGFCPLCGASYSAGDRQCRHCHAPLLRLEDLP